MSAIILNASATFLNMSAIFLNLSAKILNVSAIYLNMSAKILNNSKGLNMADKEKFKIMRTNWV